LEAAAELHWLLADQLEAPIDRAHILIRNPDPRFQCFLYVWILGLLANLLVDLGRSFRVLSSLTKQQHKEFPGVLNWHKFFSCCSIGI
jgi:hypothetical protein